MTSRVPGGKPRQQKGYILALNIAVLALMLVGATYIGQRMSLAKTMAHTEKQRMEDDIALESARAKVLFLLATVQRGKAGLGSGTQTAALDGRYYRVAKNVLVSLQDTRGLISVNAVGLDGSGRERIERLIGSYGLDNIAANRLTDILLDYRDADGLRRINGAEREEYRAAGQENFIRNDDLLAPSELGRVLSWADYSQLWQEDPITDHIGTQRRTLFNPNTADWRALVAMTGMTDAVARNLVERRQQGEIADISRLAFTSDIDNPFGMGSLVTLYPGPSILVILRTDSSSSGVQMLVTHTPLSTASPWHIEYSSRVALRPLATQPEKIPMLPEAAILREFTAKDQVQLPF